MNRRHFIKAAAVLAVAGPVLPQVVVEPAPVKSPASSILLQWYYPSDNKSHSHKYWNTPTLEAWQDAKFQALILWAEKAGCGYKVDYHEFDVIQFTHRNGSDV